jgi:hypothetical protein
VPKYPARTYEDISKQQIDADFLRNKLKLKSFEAKRAFSERHPHAEKFLKERGLELEKIRQHSAKIIGTGALAGAMLISSGGSELKTLPSPQEVLSKLKDKIVGDTENINHKFLVDTLNSILPKKPKPLKRNEEKFLEQIFKNILGVSTRANLEGEHLNTTFGQIGLEQHLRRYPNDTLSAHSTDPIVLEEGMAPGLGAWRYFSNSKEELTSELENMERWYAVVQTLYLPDWNKRAQYLRDWYKYRKVLIVNTENGNAVVAAIADSGPAAWTGKHFGGSPEVMNYLGGVKYTKGEVVVFFVDDPENKVKLGPVKYN